MYVQVCSYTNVCGYCTFSESKGTQRLFYESCLSHRSSILAINYDSIEWTFLGSYKIKLFLVIISFRYTCGYQMIHFAEQKISQHQYTNNKNRFWERKREKILLSPELLSPENSSPEFRACGTPLFPTIWDWRHHLPAQSKVSLRCVGWVGIIGPPLESSPHGSDHYHWYFILYVALFKIGPSLKVWITYFSIVWGFQIYIRNNSMFH